MCVLFYSRVLVLICFLFLFENLFSGTEKCWICDKLFLADGRDPKVRDHDHSTGLTPPAKRRCEPKPVESVTPPVRSEDLFSDFTPSPGLQIIRDGIAKGITVQHITKGVKYSKLSQRTKHHYTEGALSATPVKGTAKRSRFSQLVMDVPLTLEQTVRSFIKSSPS